jgi:hypothetical protein
MNDNPSTIELLRLGFKLVSLKVLYLILYFFAVILTFIVLLLGLIVPQIITNNVDNVLIIKENTNLLKEIFQNESKKLFNLKTTVREKIESGVEDIDMEVYSLIESIVDDNDKSIDIISTTILSELKLMFFIK